MVHSRMVSAARIAANCTVLGIGRGLRPRGSTGLRAAFQFRPEPESTFDLKGRRKSVESTNIYPFSFIFIHMAKAGRQRTILELVQESSIASQEELQRALSKRGIRVGQATLSRDIHELDLVKTADGYALPSGGTASEAALPSASRLVREFVLDVRQAQNLVVVKTAVGSAQPVAAALDGENWPEVVGTIAGDDAILIVAENNKGAARLVQRIRELLA